MEDQDERYKTMFEDASMKLNAENAKLRTEVETLKDDKALLTGQLQQSRKHVREADLRYEEACNLNHDLADMVRCLEWSNEGFCPWCMGKGPNHNGVCKLQSVIAKGYILNKRIKPSFDDQRVCPKCAGDHLEALTCQERNGVYER